MTDYLNIKDSMASKKSYKIGSGIICKETEIILRKNRELIKRLAKV